MHARQGRGQVAIALIGDDHRRAGLGDQEIGAGDADIGGEEFLAQHLARLGDEMLRLVEPPRMRQTLMRAAEIRLDGLAIEVNDRSDQMARALAPELHDIFAEIGLHHLDLGGVEMGVEPDLLRHHRLALGDELGAGLLAELQDDVARVRRGWRVMHLAAALDHLAFESLEIEIEMRQRMVLDGAGILAQPVELRQLGFRRLALLDEAALDVLQRLLQLGVAERLRGALLEVVLCADPSAALQRFCRGAAMAGSSVMPASTSATWRASMLSRSRASRPAICIRQPRSPASTVCSAGIGNVANLGIEDRGRDVRIFDREGAAEAAARFGIAELDQRQALHAAEQAPRRLAHTELAQRGAGIVIGDAPGKGGVDRADAEHADEKRGQLVALGGERLGARGAIRDPRPAAADNGPATCRRRSPTARRHSRSARTSRPPAARSKRRPCRSPEL